jgi:hypothetical protein
LLALNDALGNKALGTADSITVSSFSRSWIDRCNQEGRNLLLQLICAPKNRTSVAELPEQAHYASVLAALQLSQVLTLVEFGASRSQVPGLARFVAKAAQQEQAGRPNSRVLAHMQSRLRENRLRLLLDGAEGLQLAIEALHDPMFLQEISQPAAPLMLGIAIESLSRDGAKGTPSLLTQCLRGHTVLSEQMAALGYDIFMYKRSHWLGALATLLAIDVPFDDEGAALAQRLCFEGQLGPHSVTSALAANALAVPATMQSEVILRRAFERLAELGINLDEPDPHRGVTPLMLALATKNWDNAEALLRAGADPKAPSALSYMDKVDREAQVAPLDFVREIVKHPPGTPQNCTLDDLERYHKAVALLAMMRALVARGAMADAMHQVILPAGAINGT